LIIANCELIIMKEQLKESSELTAIFIASRKTASKNNQ